MGTPVEEKKDSFMSVTLPCALSDERRADLSKTLAHLNHQTKNIKEVKKDISRMHEATIKSNEKKIDDIAAELVQGFEMRSVQCSEKIDALTGEKVTIRNDTGEVVHAGMLMPAIPQE